MWTTATASVLGIWFATVASATDPSCGVGDFDVAFDQCTEFAGIGYVPYAEAAARVPAGYTVAGDGVSAIVVVRVADCESVSVAGHSSQAGTLSQIGVTVVGPDGDADIDNYTLWYVTDVPRLHARLSDAGIDSVLDDVHYAFTPDGSGGGSLDITVDPPRGPDHELHGTAQVPTSTPTTFVARWWQDGPYGTVQMRTEFPDIQFSQASMTLTTSAGSDLADLIGSTTMTFSILDSYNAVGNADMTVTVD